MRIIGVDPGTNIMGYSIIDVQGKAISICSLGVVRLDQLQSHEEKLGVIFEKINFLIQSWEPKEMAVEAPFFGKNVQAMLKLGRAQGAVITAGVVSKLNVTEYSPKKVKQSVTGNGNASKEQMSAMLKQLLKIEKMPKYFDASDALGVAMCHHFSLSSVIPSGKKSNSWEAFIRNNPDKVKQP